MDTKFLRKIILEEIKKVLEEETYGGYDPDKDTADYAIDPKDKGDKRDISDSIKNIQKLASFLSRKPLKVDGKVGPELIGALTQLSKVQAYDYPKLAKFIPALQSGQGFPKTLIIITSILQNAKDLGSSEVMR